MPEERKERLGINIKDVSRALPELREMLGLSRKIDMNIANVVHIDKNIQDDRCIPFICSLREAALVCDVIRKHDRDENRYPTRVYICKQSAWERIPSDVILTVVETDEEGNKQCVLNPKVFPLEVVLAEPIIPEAKRFEL